MAMRDYEELVQELRRLADEQFFDFEKSPYIKAADAIEELRKRVASCSKSVASCSKWISVEEQLPKYGKIVLTVGVNARTKAPEYLLDYVAQDWEGNPFWVHSLSAWRVAPEYWMPLPEPPKED